MKVTVEVFITHACPHCASAEELVANVVAASGKERFDLRIIDVIEELDHAVATGVLRTPAIAIDGALKFTGLPSGNALRRTLETAAESMIGHTESLKWQNSA